MPNQEDGRSPQRIAVTAWFVGALTFVALRFVAFFGDSRHFGWKRRWGCGRGDFFSCSNWRGVC